MGKFLLGIVVAMAYYNQATVMRAYYRVHHEVVAVEKGVETEPYRIPPPLDTSQAVREPTQEQLVRLGVHDKKH